VLFIFNIIFWKEKPGVNTILFAFFICASVFYLYPYSLRNSACSWLWPSFISCINVWVQNTLLSEISFSVTLLCYFILPISSPAAWYAGGICILNYVLVVPNFLSGRSIFQKQTSGLERVIETYKNVLIPFLMSLFSLPFTPFANTIFSNIGLRCITAIEKWLAHVLMVSLERSEFFLLEFTSLRADSPEQEFIFFRLGHAEKNKLLREKNDLKKWKESSLSDLLSVVTGKKASGIMALKNELTSGKISLILLNILLFVINIIDLKICLAGIYFSKSVNMAAYVHEGAWLLILSIVLGNALLLFFFRNNLNFYKKTSGSGRLLPLDPAKYIPCGIGIFQDYYYISHYVGL